MDLNRPTSGNGPPDKRPRPGDSNPGMHIQLRTDAFGNGAAGQMVDSLGAAGYDPQVAESILDESSLPSTVGDLMLNIARVDQEISKAERHLAKLKANKIDLEEAAESSQKEKDESSGSTPDDVVIVNFFERIYAENGKKAAEESSGSTADDMKFYERINAENRKKATEAHHSVLKLCPLNDLPVYTQLSEMHVYQENLAKHKEFKPRLVSHLKSKQKEAEKRDTCVAKTYAELSIEWARNVERIENTPMRKEQEMRKRQLFEKVFPELHKQLKRRFPRVSKINSGVDQEVEHKKMRSSAVIPPSLLDVKTRRRYKNTNGLIEDPMQEYKNKKNELTKNKETAHHVPTDVKRAN